MTSSRTLVDLLKQLRMDNSLAHSKDPAVLVHLQELERLGYELERHPLGAMRIIHSPDRLLAEEIESLLKEEDGRFSIHVFRSTESTNLLAERAGMSGESEGMIYMADEQTGGRGRMGRKWDSRPHLGLWMSLLLRPQWPPTEFHRLTTLSAAALAVAVDRFSGISTTIKWPNDILWKARKIAGILVETYQPNGHPPFAVVGIGLNVNHQESDFPEDLKSSASSLALATGKNFRRGEMAALLLDEFWKAYQSPFRKTLDVWREKCSTLGREVKTTGHGTACAGKAESIDDDGSLVVRDIHGMPHAIRTGEIVHLS